MLLRLSVLTASILLTLTACDFQPVAVGEWNIVIESPNGKQTAVWIIDADGSIEMQGGMQAPASEVVLAGSHISWSLDTPSIELPGETSRINFRGTVNGNELAGTLFTRQGNMSVYGKRR